MLPEMNTWNLGGKEAAESEELLKTVFKILAQELKGQNSLGQFTLQVTNQTFMAPQNVISFKHCFISSCDILCLTVNWISRTLRHFSYSNTNNGF